MNKLILILIFVIISSSFSYSQIFEDNEKFAIRDSSLILLEKYVKYADLTEDGTSISDDYCNSFLTLFTEDANLINDLYGKILMLSPDEYINMVTNKYSGGIEVKAQLDSTYFKGLKKVEGELYSVQIDCKKNTIGLNNQNKIIRKDILSTFTIFFKYKEGILSNFKINEIISKEVILQQQSNEKMKGLYIGANINAHTGRLLTDNNFEYYNRDFKLSSVFSGGIFADYFLSSHYALSLGIDYYNFNASFNTKYNNETNNNLARTDVDNDNYYLYVDADFSEKNTLTFVSLPIKFKYRQKLYNDISLFASAGFSTSYLLKSYSYIHGVSAHSAWYQDYNLLIDEAELYNLGESNYDEKYDFLLDKLFFSGLLEIGISIPIKKTSYLNVGGSINQNFSNIKYKGSSFRDDYVSLHGTPKYLFIQSGGIFFSYLFKL